MEKNLHVNHYYLKNSLVKYSHPEICVDKIDDHFKTKSSAKYRNVINTKSE